MQWRYRVPRTSARRKTALVVGHVTTKFGLGSAPSGQSPRPGNPRLESPVECMYVTSSTSRYTSWTQDRYGKCLQKHLKHAHTLRFFGTVHEAAWQHIQIPFPNSASQSQTQRFTRNLMSTVKASGSVVRINFQTPSCDVSTADHTHTLINCSSLH